MPVLHGERCLLFWFRVLCFCTVSLWHWTQGATTTVKTQHYFTDVLWSNVPFHEDTPSMDNGCVSIRGTKADPGDEHWQSIK